MIYLTIIILLSFLIYYYDYCGNNRGRLFWIIIITLILIALGTLRYRIGIDSPGYERFYRNISPLNYITIREIESSRFAPGYVVLGSFAKMLSEEIILLNFIQSAFVCSIVSWFFYKNARHIFLAFLIFFLFCYTLLIFEQVREGIAVGLFLIAFPTFAKRQWIYWYALSFCAIMFHTSATFMFVLPLILLPGVRQLFIYGKRTYIICGVVLVGAFVLQVTFSKYIELLAVTQSMEDMTQKYANTHYVEGSLNPVGIIGQLMRFVVYPLIALNCLFVNRDRVKNSYNQTIETFTLLSVYISLLSIGVPIISRFNNYFFFFPILIMSSWVFDYVKIHKKKVKFGFAYWVLFLLPMFGFQLMSYTAGINKTGTYKTYMAYYPYTNQITKEKDINKERTINYAQKRH